MRNSPKHYYANYTGFVQTNMSIERKKIFELLREKRRTCKTCGNMVFGTIEELVVSHVSISERQGSIFCVMCPNCSKKRRGQLFICISCGRVNSRSAKMILNNGCKCSGVPDPASSMYNVRHQAENAFNHYCENLEEFHPELNDVDNGQHPAGELSLIHDCMDLTRSMVECETPLQAVASSVDVQFNDGAWETFDENDTDCFDDKKMDEKMESRTLEMPTSFQPENFFNQENDWSLSSRNYLINEHTDRTGLKGIVYRAMIDHNRMSCYDCLSEMEMYFHLLSTIIHHNSSRNESIQICSMLEHSRTENEELLFSIKESLFSSLDKQTRIALEATLPESVVGGILERVHAGIRYELDSHYINMPQSPRITTYKEARAKYLDGPKSILQNLPMPTPSIKTLFTGTDRACSYAHIPANQILNHILALGYDCYFYRAGFEKDWTDIEHEVYPMFTDDDTYPCEFFRDAHNDVKEMMRNDPAMPKETRVVILRVWSDGFEAHNVKGNIKFNSLQVFTLKLKGPKDQTLPYALCFKTFNVREIFVQLLKELFDLRQVRPRYWGKDKKIFPTVALLELVSNDYPERCFNTGITQNGNYTKRFGHSCLYDKVSTPSCPCCQLQRMQIILGRSQNLTVHPCAKCSDWWAKVERGNKYPVPPGGDITKVGMVELTFELITNSLRDLEVWYQENIGKSTGVSMYAQKYMNVLGICGSIADGLMKSLRKSQPLVDSESYPAILKSFKDMNIELDMFPSMPMHMCFLGVEKSLLDQTKNILQSGRVTAQAKFWKELIKPMRSRQQALNAVSIDWCLPMMFSGEAKNDIGPANWQSDHCLAFTRISLFQFADLDGMSGLVRPSQLNRVIASFKRMRVVWFCLVSNMFCDLDYISIDFVEHLIRMFLSCCKDFSEHSSDDRLDPFFSSQSNIFSLLNCPAIIKKYGSLSGIWEGEDEAFIRSVKSEISTMRYQTSHLKSLLVRLLQTKTLNYLNRNNPLDKSKVYARTNHVRVYAKGATCQEPSMILEQEVFVSGSINRRGDIFICFEERAGQGIKLIPVVFDDLNGKWCLNLWYANARLGSNIQFVCDRAELKEFSQDYFLMLRHSRESSLWTVICRSWRIRDNSGDLSLPLPQRGILTIEACL